MDQIGGPPLLPNLGIGEWTCGITTNTVDSRVQLVRKKIYCLAQSCTVRQGHGRGGGGGGRRCIKAQHMGDVQNLEKHLRPQRI